MDSQDGPCGLLAGADAIRRHALMKGAVTALEAAPTIASIGRAVAGDAGSTSAVTGGGDPVDSVVRPAERGVGIHDWNIALSKGRRQPLSVAAGPLVTWYSRHRNVDIVVRMDSPKTPMEDVVLTIVGSDRPGLVEAVAEAVARAGGNWLESRMAHLAGQFAGILRVQAPTGVVPRLVSAIEDLSHADLKVTVERGGARPAGGPQRALELDLVGLDRPGIVRDISGVLARHGANIEELVTDSSSAPMSGELLFRAHVRVNVPGVADLARLRSELEQFATDLMVELRLVETVTKTTPRSGAEHAAPAS